MVTWLKPTSEARWWEQQWSPWVVRVRKGGRAHSRPWVTPGVDRDTVQVPLSIVFLLGR